MTIARGFVITIASIIGFGVLGAIMGYNLALIAPDYYRIVFDIPKDHTYRMTQLGLGLGVTQGGGAGLVVGLGVVFAVAWYNLRITRQKPADSVTK